MLEELTKKEIDVQEMARKLVALRGNKNPDKVAEAVGISRSALDMYEKGERVPRDKVKLRLAMFYKKSIPFIFFNLIDHKS